MVDSQATHSAQQLRLAFLRIASLVIGGFTIVALGISFTDPTLPASTIPLQVMLVASCGASFWLGRRGFDTAGGVLLSLGLIIAITFTATAEQLTGRAIGSAYIIAILVAGMVSGAGAVLLTSGLSLLILGAVALRNPSPGAPVATAMLIIAVIGGLAWFIFRSQRRLLLSAETKTQEAIQAQQRIEEREQALLTSNAQLGAANEAQASMIQTIQDLETPAIPLLDGVLVVPLVGHLDTRRMDHLQSSVLGMIHAQKTHTLILDITGIAFIDTAVAQHLHLLGQAAQLLGVKVMLTGISAGVASTVVALGLNFNAFETLARLQDGVLRILELQASHVIGPNRSWKS